MALAGLIIKTLGNMARTTIDAAAQQQSAAPAPTGGRRSKKKAVCEPCMARGAVAESRANAIEMRKQFRIAR